MYFKSFSSNKNGVLPPLFSNSPSLLSFLPFELFIFSNKDNTCRLLVHLVQIGKLRRPDCRDVGKAAAEALQVLEDYGIKMMPVSEKHIRRLVELPLYEDHRDPNDRLIIAQAICDRIPLVSSDQKFVRYGRYGLELIFNRR